MQVEPIGIVRTDHLDPDDTPVQAAANLGEQGVAVVDDRYLDALDGLEQFSHAWLLTWLGTTAHAAADVALRQRPFLRPNGPPMGIFAMRGPRRPNPIGLSLVEIVAVEGSALRFRGVDMVDGTPLLDIKPYFRDADQPTSAIKCGWFDDVVMPDRATPLSLGGDEQTLT